ncbi:MAG: hypothetical protein MUC64_06760 [Rubritepida sp.]|jgi:dihydrodipicolinate reductase|nr:hypothetical protein [Rubritepida sp.]
MSTGIFVRLLIAGVVALAGLIVAAMTHFHLALGEAVTLRHDTIGLIIFAAGLLFGYRTVKKHYDAADAAHGA